jgi:hypothetical protein
MKNMLVFGVKSNVFLMTPGDVIVPAQREHNAAASGVCALRHSDRSHKAQWRREIVS